jgi:hypothetical protein
LVLQSGKYRMLVDMAGYQEGVLEAASRVKQLEVVSRTSSLSVVLNITLRVQ